MNPTKRKCLVTLAVLGAFSQVMAADPAPAAQQEEKVKKITFVQDDAQNNVVSRLFVLKYTKAADILPFVKSALIRYNNTEDAFRINAIRKGKQEMLLVSTTYKMMPYIIDMIPKLDRRAKIDRSGTNISGTGIAYGTYSPQFRSAQSMRDLVVNGGVSSGIMESKVEYDSATGMFYMKDTPYKVKDIIAKLKWLDTPIPQSRIEFKIYEVRNSDLRDIGIDYMAWKNGPGMNLFSVGYEALNFRVAEVLLEQLAKHGLDVAGNFSYGFGGFYTAPAFDFSFVRILQQNGKATINSTASLMVTNTPGKTFRISFSPEYQNILKDADHRTSVNVGGNATLDAVLSNVIVTAGRNGIVNFDCNLLASNVVERNNRGTEISENTNTNTSASLNFKQEKLLASWTRSSKVEQTIGVPFLCELPILKYIFGVTTSNMEVTHYFVTAKAVAVYPKENLKPGLLAEFDDVVKASK